MVRLRTTDVTTLQLPTLSAVVLLFHLALLLHWWLWDSVPAWQQMGRTITFRSLPESLSFDDKAIFTMPATSI